MVAATEESFGRISTVARMSETNPYYNDTCSTRASHDPDHVAKMVFPAIYKHMVKYLKSCQMSKYHTMDSIMHQLSTFIKFGMSPQSFLSQYLQPPSVVQVKCSNRY